MTGTLVVARGGPAVTRPDERERMAQVAAACARAEAGGRGQVTAALRREASAIGVGYGTLRRHYDRWLAAGRDASALADGRKMRAGGGHNRWLQVFARYCENDINTSANAWDVMMADFRAGSCADGAPYAEVFSGVGTWREAWARERRFDAEPPEYPSGWVPAGASEGHLRRAAARDPDRLFQVAAARQGRRAAHGFLLGVLKTRRGVPVGAIRQWDDVWHNFDVRLPDTRQVAQPLEFAGYDVASAYKCDSVMKPRFTRDDGRRDNLKEQTFRFAVGCAHCVTGFHAGGVTNIVEWGTAAIRPPVERQIRLIPTYGALIGFRRSGILSEQVHAGLFVGGAGGNFRMKPLVEASHNVMHNAAAHLPGSRGRDAGRMHESRGAMVRYEERLMRAAAALPPDAAAMILYGLLSFDEYCAAFREVERRVMRDHLHTLEGWDGRQVTQYSLAAQPSDNDWHDIRELLDIDPAEAAARAEFLRAHPQCVRRHYMSRYEAWMAGQKDLVRVPLMEMPAFLDERDMIELTVRDNGTVEFGNHYFYGRDKVAYRVDALKDPGGYTRRLAPRERVLVKYNPFVPGHVWVIDRDNGGTVGMAPLHERAPMMDRRAIEAAMGAQAHDLARKVRPVRGRHQPEAVARAARMASNQAAMLGLARALPARLEGEGGAAALPGGENDFWAEEDEGIPEAVREAH